MIQAGEHRVFGEDDLQQVVAGGHGLHILPPPRSCAPVGTLQPGDEQPVADSPQHSAGDQFRLKDLWEPGKAGERVAQLAGETGVVSLLPEIERAFGQKRFGIDWRVDDPRLLVLLDLLEKRLAATRKLECVDLVLLVDRHDNPVGLPNHSGQFLLCLLDVAAQALPADGVDLLHAELSSHILPAQQAPRLAACGVHAFS